MNVFLTGLFIVLKFSLQPADSFQDSFILLWGTGNGVFENQVDVGNQVKFTKDIDFAGKSKICFAFQAKNQAGISPRSSQTCYQAPSAPFGVKVE